MASLSTNKKDGNKRIRFKTLDSQRKSIRLGRLPKKDAEIVRSYVSRLETAQQVGDLPDANTQKWLSRISEALHAKLACVGLVAERKLVTLGDFIDQYIRSKANMKPNTVKNYQATRKSLLEFFGADRALTDITAGDCDNWHEWQVSTKGHSPATIGRNVKRARQFFRAAVRHKLLSDNPLADVKAAAQVNKSREFFITREVTERVIAACPDAEWRLIFTLARYGGVRVPSELLAVRWVDVDWERGRFRVCSPKTEHHPGKEAREVPLFPELRPYLEEVWEQAEPGEEYVITRYRNGNANLRTQLVRIIERAGVQQWPRIFQNLRSSRETELTEEWPIQVACAWIGNSEAVAKKHYLQVTEKHFQRAVMTAQQKRGEPVGKAGHKCAHTAPVRGPNASYQETQNLTLPGNIKGYEVLGCYTDIPVPPRGVEPIADSSENQGVSYQSGAKSGPLDSTEAPATHDPNLAVITIAWPALSDKDRKAILAIVRRASAKKRP